MAKDIGALEGIAIDHVLGEVRKAIDYANSDATHPINSVDILLKLNVSGSAGIDFTIPIVNASGKAVGKVSKTAEMSVTLEPKPSKVTREAFMDVTEQIKKLKELIAAAQKNLPDLSYKSAKVKMDFTVTETGSITFILTGSEEAQVTNSLTISFGK